MPSGYHRWQHVYFGLVEPVATDPEPDETDSTESAEKRESRKTAKAPPKMDEPVDRKDKEEALRIEAEAQAAREAAEYAAKRKWRNLFFTLDLNQCIIASIPS